MENKEYTTSDVLKMFGINRSTFQSALDKGFIEPSINKSSKQGESNKFTIEDIYLIACYQQMVKNTLQRKTAATFIKSLEKQKELFSELIKNNSIKNYVVLFVVNWSKFHPGEDDTAAILLDRVGTLRMLFDDEPEYVYMLNLKTVYFIVNAALKKI